MKKIILSLICLGLTGVSLAQNKVGFGLKAGLALPHMTISAGGNAISFNSKTSFYVGCVANIKASNLWSVQPGISLVNKGTRIKDNGFGFDESIVESEAGTINLTYLEIPVNLMLNLPTGKSGKIFLGAGPYYAIALSGNVKYGGIKEDINFGSDEDDIKRGEFGFNFLGGYQLDNGLNLHLGYGLGVSSLIQDQGYDVKFKNRVFSVGLGFNF